MKRLTTEEFVEKTRKIHGNKYDYSKVEYKDSHTKVSIICPIHGEFLQTPNNHLNGQQCPFCSYPNINLSKEKFVSLAKNVHGDKYDYSKVVYKNAKDKLIIICPIHGEFLQSFEKHVVRGQGCPKCAGKNKDASEFIFQANKIHKNKYDYSKTNYISATTKVTIICPIHGEFLQAPAKHLCGDGCPKCNSSKLESSLREYLDSKNIKFEEHKTFSWLKYKKNMYLDFYLPEHNIAIECQGEQHFFPVDYAGLGREWAEKQLIINQNRDKVKKELCEANGIKVLYFTEDNKDSFRII